MSFLKTLLGVKLNHNDLIRILVGVALMVALFYPDMSNFRIIAVIAGFFIGIAMIAHLVRKLLFPYFDLGEALRESMKEPLAAAIVAASFIYFLSQLHVVAAQFFVRN